MKYAFQKFNGEVCGVADEATTDQYPVERYHLDVHFEDEAYLVAIPQKYRKVAENVQIGVDGESNPIYGDKVVEMSQAEKDAVDAALLSASQAAQTVIVEQAVCEYIEEHFTPQKQRTFGHMLSKAQSDGDKPNRIAHMEILWAWMDSVVDYGISLESQIEAAESVAAVEAIVPDFSTYDTSFGTGSPAPENVSIFSAKAITD